MQTPIIHLTEQINGIEMHIARAGNPQNTPLILLHGFPEFWYGWRHQVDALVDAGFCLYMPDQRGYNLTEKPKLVSDYSLDILADDLFALMDFSGVEKGRVIAHDWGGGVAWWAANRQPERFERLAVLNIAHHRVFSKAVRSDPEQRRKSWYMQFFQLNTLPEILVRAGNWYALIWWAFGKSRDAFPKETLRAYKKAWSQPGAMHSMINWYRAVRRNPPTRLSSPQIHVKTLLIWGMRDHTMSHTMAQPSIDLCDDGQVIFIEHASHWVQHEAAEEVNQHLIAFFK